MGGEGSRLCCSLAMVARREGLAGCSDFAIESCGPKVCGDVGESVAAGQADIRG